MTSHDVATAQARTRRHRLT